MQVDLWMCLLGGRAFGFDSRASGRANNGQTVTLEFIADNVGDLIGEFANGGAAVLLHHPVLLPLRGAIVSFHVWMICRKFDNKFEK